MQCLPSGQESPHRRIYRMTNQHGPIRSLYSAPPSCRGEACALLDRTTTSKYLPCPTTEYTCRKARVTQPDCVIRVRSCISAAIFQWLDHQRPYRGSHLRESKHNSKAAPYLPDGKASIPVNLLLRLSILVKSIIVQVLRSICLLSRGSWVSPKSC